MKKLVQFCIYILILLMPIFGIGEGLGVVGYTFSEDLLFKIKLLRDLLLIVVFILGLLNFFFKKQKKSLILSLSILLIFTILVVIFSSNLLMILSGVRWTLPLFLVLLLIDLIDRKFIKKISLLLFYLVIVNLIMQIYQMFNMPPIRGSIPFGLSGRVAGFLSLPSVSGTFAAFTAFLIIYESNLKDKKKILGFSFCLLSVLISMSSTAAGLIFVILIFPYFLRSKYKIFLAFIFVPIVLLAVNNLDGLTGRSEGSSYKSISTRQEIFENQLKESEIISTKFGFATNAAVNLRKNMNFKNKSFIADSFYTSFLTNYGWLFFIVLLSTLLILGFLLVYSKKYEVQLFYILVLLSSVSLIITEIYPLNIILPLICSIYISESRIKII